MKVQLNSLSPVKKEAKKFRKSIADEFGVSVPLSIAQDAIAKGYGWVCYGALYLAHLKGDGLEAAMHIKALSEAQREALEEQKHQARLALLASLEIPTEHAEEGLATAFSRKRSCKQKINILNPDKFLSGDYQELQSGAALVGCKDEYTSSLIQSFLAQKAADNGAIFIVKNTAAKDTFLSLTNGADDNVLHLHKRMRIIDCRDGHSNIKPMPLLDALKQKDIDQAMSILKKSSYGVEVDGEMWRGRSLRLAKNVLQAIFELSEISGKEVTEEDLFDNLRLDNLVKLAYNKELSEKSRKGLILYMGDTPFLGSWSFNDDIPTEAYTHHGYVCMTLTHIYRAARGEDPCADFPLIYVNAQAPSGKDQSLQKVYPEDVINKKLIVFLIVDHDSIEAAETARQFLRLTRDQFNALEEKLPGKLNQSGVPVFVSDYDRHQIPGMAIGANKWRESLGVAFYPVLPGWPGEAEAELQACLVNMPVVSADPPPGNN